MIIKKYNKLLNMKLQPIYILASVIMLMAFASCKKELLKTNTDPNAVSVGVFDPNNILTTTQLLYTGSTNNAIEVEETEMEGAGCFIQHFASTSFFGDKYLLNTGAFSSFFDNVYPSAVKYAVDLYSITTDKPQYKNLHQISRIMKVLVLQRITDVYGDVPYFQAGLGYHSSVFFPAYDKQQDIYTDMLKEVSEAVAALDEKADQPIGDLFYSGRDDQIAEWKKLGNSLLLRLAMRLTKIDPTTAQKYATQVQGLTMTSNDDNAIVNFNNNNDPLTINRIYRGMGEDGAIQLSWQISNTFINFLKSTQDPRLPVLAYFYSPTWVPPVADDNPTIGTADTAQLHGLPNGYDNTAGPRGLIHFPGYLGNINLYARPSPIIFNATAPYLVLTYAETELLLADAAKRWGITKSGSAATHYQNGVTNGITQLAAYGDAGVIDGADDYYSANPYNDAKGLEMINNQYWVTTFFDEYEAWSNYRRTGYPALVPVPSYTGTQSPNAIPRRMQYSTNDKQVNPVNYNAAVARLTGGDKITSRVWWDK
jgi:hypothetical protein